MEDEAPAAISHAQVSRAGRKGGPYSKSFGGQKKPVQNMVVLNLQGLTGSPGAHKGGADRVLDEELGQLNQCPQALY